ncbi:unnamed protein product [Acanthoscelides obtectus]|uniref:Uncharacterized protein n=1 Tax=Acanthoscelides obtectus TaxID=200917 RepID=A0A9P0KN88_ACAOB|nr:unnamed protein product [Acanthoscelides obtectus]CAK1671667.1 hypothetical protein AOBTE_LOCUS28392 [Acanthoscelides obtectus]
MSFHKHLNDVPIDRQTFIRVKIRKLLYSGIISATQYQENTTNGLNVQNSAVNTQYINPPPLSSVYSNTSASNSKSAVLL